MPHHDESGLHSFRRNYIDPHIDTTALGLRPEEELISAYEIEYKPPQHLLAATEALRLLAGVERVADIGKNGPVIAARVLPEHEGISELRLYEVLFGRDSLLVALFVFDQFPELTRATILRLAHLQGLKRDMLKEEEPGKIIHEACDPDSPLGKHLTQERGWQWPYYGAVDATLLFVQAIHRYVQKYGAAFLHERYEDQHGESKKVLQALDAAVDWIIAKMKENPEGFVESRRLNTIGGNTNQGWKDSFDSYHHHDGSLANTNQGVASIEVQSLAYDALLNAADMYTHLGGAHMLRSMELEHTAAHLRDSIMNLLWITDTMGDYFALGSDRDDQGKLRPLQVRTSNAGHVLDSRLFETSSPADAKKKKAIVTMILADDMLTTYGIRTLSSRENRYRPTSYHNGSVWPWDTYKISVGLLRHGYKKEAADLHERIKKAVRAAHCFPEFVSGAENPTSITSHRAIFAHDTKYHFEHLVEQPPQEIQAWTVAAAVALGL